MRGAEAPVVVGGDAGQQAVRLCPVAGIAGQHGGFVDGQFKLTSTHRLYRHHTALGAGRQQLLDVVVGERVVDDLPIPPGAGEVALAQPAQVGLGARIVLLTADQRLHVGIEALHPDFELQRAGRKLHQHPGEGRRQGRVLDRGRLGVAGVVHRRAQPGVIFR